MRRVLAFLTTLLTACATSAPKPTPIQQQTAVMASDETRGTIEELRGAIAGDPGNGALIYTLAQYLDRSGDTAEALRWLSELDRIGWMRGVNDHDFRHSIAAAGSAYRALAARLNARVPRVVRGSEAFVIPQPDLVPEGIAFDPATGDFYASSIYLRKIVRITPDGQSHDFTTEGQDGLFSTVGLKVDAARRLLWVASAATAEMHGYSDAMAGQAGVFAYDLRDGHLVTRVMAGSAGDPSLLNDLTLLEDGSALITDTDSGAVMRVHLGGESMDAWLPDGTFMLPNGIAAAPGEPFVYIADFHGIARVDVRSRTVTPLDVPEDEYLGGIDGLVWDRGSLIGIQNAFGQPRILRAALSRGRDAVERVDLLESGNPLFDEPTTCAMASESLYYFANPQLRAFDDNHAIWPRERLKDVVVLKMRL